MPSVFQRPSLREGVFVLRAPAPPVVLGGRYLPPIYTEEDLRRAGEEAQARGREEAAAELEQARREMTERAREDAESLRSVLLGVRQAREELLAEAGEGLVELSFAIARKVLRRETETDPGVVLPLVRELLQRSAVRSGLIVRLSPRDHAFLAQRLESLPEAVGMEGLHLSSDPRVSPGGCVLESEAGGWDGRVETQLARIEAALRKREPEFHAEASGPGTDGDERP